MKNRTAPKRQAKGRKPRRLGVRILAATVFLAAGLILLSYFAPNLLTRTARYVLYLSDTVLHHRGISVSELKSDGFSRDEQGWVTYQADGIVGVPGIDVSSHQGEIDWQAVSDSGIQFAILRAVYRGYAQEGVLQEDARFLENAAQAHDAGLKVGAYLFSQATTREEVEEELTLLFDLLDQCGRKTITGPVVFDWERMPPERNARTKNVTGKELTDMAAYFCQRVKQAGYEPCVYFNLNMAYRWLDLSKLKSYTFWLAEYGDTPSFEYACALWQYSHTGTVPGIKHNVDMNLMFEKSYIY